VAAGWQLAQASIVAGGRRADGNRHVETIATQAGTAWLEEALRAAIAKHRPARLGYDATGPARALKAMLERVATETDTKLVALSGADYAAACEAFATAATSKQTRHLGGAEMAAAIKTAKIRALSGGWCWAWPSAPDAPDISPLAAATVADWLAAAQPGQRRSAYEPDTYHA
jgi:hypothetical protein